MVRFELSRRSLRSSADGLHDLPVRIDGDREAILPEIVRDRITGRDPSDQLRAGALPELYIIRCRRTDERSRRLRAARVRCCAVSRFGALLYGRRACREQSRDGHKR